MTEQLQEQLVNELRAVLKPINEKYKDFFHINIITLCDMKDQSCSVCVESEAGQKCMRCVLAVEDKSDGE